MNAYQIFLPLVAAVLLGCSVGNPLSPDAGTDGGASPSVLQGERFVQARRCAQCHQSANPDDGVLSGQTLPQPGTRTYGRNLTPDDATGIGGWSDEALLLAIRFGVDDRGSHLCAPMPQFMTMGDGEGVAIVAYLRSLAPVLRVIPPSTCALDSREDDGGAATVEEGGVDRSDAAADAALGDAAIEVVITETDAGCIMLAPDAAASCTGCTTSHCQQNGCYGGSWCQASTQECHRKPPNCP